jgi:NlpC/P60 family protein
MTLVLSVLAATLLSGPKAYAFSDVPSSNWAYTQITFVASTHDWMQDYGTSTFKPTTQEARKFLARALVRAYASSERVDPRIHFADLPDSDPFYPYANVAAKLGWMPKYTSGNWAPDGSIQTSGFDQALIMAMGNLKDAIAGLADIHQADGNRYKVGGRFPHMILAHFLGLHFNHSTESLDITATTLITRDEVAYSLWKSKNLYSWQISAAARFDTIELPALDPGNAIQAAKQEVTQYSLDQAGFPYIWGGEWKTASPSGYCCGYQPKGGMDCSGFVWWTMKKYEDGYNAAKYHPTYAGWVLHQRTSSQMAQYAPTHLRYGDLRIGDLMFIASNGGSSYADVDHVGLYIGNDWMIHSASSHDGVAIDYVAEGWYYDNFVYGRRLIGTGSSSSADSLESLPGDWRLGGDEL